MGVVYALGLVAVVLRHQEIPLAPVVLGAVLGPLLEQYTRRALAIADGDPTVFLTRPLSAALLGLALALVVLPPLVRAIRTRI